MAGGSILHNKLKAYVCSSNKALEIKLVRNENDIHSGDEWTTFRPEFTHQVFGDNESIFGYKDLAIQLYYVAGNLTTYLGMTYSEKIDPQKFDGVEADVVIGNIAEKLQPGFLTNMDEFAVSIPTNDKFEPLGDKLHEFSVLAESDNVERHYEIYKADLLVPGFRDYNERLQMFVLWYIDAASFIDSDDDKWKFYLAYEKYKCQDKYNYGLVGFGTVYHYYAYPTLIRPRISQLLILPPFQKQGIGAELLQTIYNYYNSDPNVLDITVEDPSEEFIRLRDYLDAKNCFKLSSFQRHRLHDGFTEEMAAEAQTKLKLNKKQARRVYEILRLHVTDTANEEQYRMYRLDVKKRLNVPFQKQQSDFSKLQRTLRPEELKAAMSYTSRDQRIEQLDRMYLQLEEEYRRVLERVATSKMM